MIKYRGRQILSLDRFLLARPDIKKHYIYDILLSSGDLLLSCKGGIGQTPEDHISKMYDFFSRINSLNTLYSVYTNTFNSRLGRGTYLRIRTKFNEAGGQIYNWKDCATLYLLWCGSNFAHSYNQEGYIGSFRPINIDWKSLQYHHQTLRSKFFSFRQTSSEDIHGDLITPETIIHARLPDSYGHFGRNLHWTPATQDKLVSAFKSFDECGYKICLVCKNSVKIYDKSFLSSLNCVSMDIGFRYKENFYLNF